MSIQQHSEHIIFVDLLDKEPQIAEELKNINLIMTERNDCDVIIDFSRVEVFVSSSLSNLLILQDILHKNGHRLFLCNVEFATRCIFTVAGLNEQFTFVKDKYEALEELNSVPNK